MDIVDTIKSSVSSARKLREFIKIKKKINLYNLLPERKKKGFLTEQIISNGQWNYWTATLRVNYILKFIKKKVFFRFFFVP